MNELWRPVVGRPDYQVSNLGRVRSPRQILKPSHDGKYLVVKVGTVKPVHKLVAEAWLGPRPEGMYVLHGPKGALDNSLENLSYGTPRQNALDKQRDGTEQTGTKNGQHKLTDAQVLEIRSRASQSTQQQLADEFGVCQRTISVIIRRLGWKHLA